jgi:hypothetical protein
LGQPQTHFAKSASVGVQRLGQFGESQ